jgi:hypothetical protein
MVRQGQIEIVVQAFAQRSQVGRPHRVRSAGSGIVKGQWHRRVSDPLVRGGCRPIGQIEVDFVIIQDEPQVLSVRDSRGLGPNIGSLDRVHRFATLPE